MLKALETGSSKEHVQVHLILTHRWSIVAAILPASQRLTDYLCPHAAKRILPTSAHRCRREIACDASENQQPVVLNALSTVETGTGLCSLVTPSVESLPHDLLMAFP